MLLTANIKGSFIITFAMVYNYRLTSSVKYSMIINNFANRFLWGLTKTGSWALQEQLDLLTPNGLVWWRILFTILTVRFRALQELIDYWHLLVWNVDWQYSRYRDCLYYQ